MDIHTAPKIGEVYWMEFNGNDHEQRGLRPAVVLQNNTGNMYSPNIIALPITSQIKSTYLPVNVFLPKHESGLPKDGTVICNNPMTISKSRVKDYVSTLSDATMERIAWGSLVATGASVYLSTYDFSKIKIKSEKLNYVVSNN